MAVAKFVAVGDRRITSSDDGVNFTQRVTPFGASIIADVEWSSKLKKFIALSIGGRTSLSSDGVTWDASVRLEPPANPIVTTSTVCVSDSLILVGGDNGIIYRSTDGINWNSVLSGMAAPVGDLGWSPELNLFVAAGSAGKIATSPDGINWTLRVSGLGATAAAGVAWSKELGLFVVTANLGQLVTSPDGINWTPRVSGFGGDHINDVRWSSEQGLFVAVGNLGKLTTSPNGTAWTLRASGFGADFIGDVAWSPSLGLWAVAGGAGKVAWSPDGINWTMGTGGVGVFELYAITASLLADNIPWLRQRQRDDSRVGFTRAGNGPTSKQASIRQGWGEHNNYF